MRPEPPESYPPPAKTPDIEYGRVNVNWTAIAIIVAIVGVLALVAPVVAFGVGAVIVLILIVNNTGTGRWIPGGIGDDTNAAIPKRDKRPRDY